MPDSKQTLGARKALYTEVFGTPKGRLVLRDLMTHAHVLVAENVVTGDPELLRHYEGRRWLFSRIANHLNLDVEDLYRIYEEGKTL